MADEVQRDHIDSPIRSDTVVNNSDECHKVVDGADNADQKMKIFDINGLECKYLNTIINRSCHSNSLVILTGARLKVDSQLSLN